MSDKDNVCKKLFCETFEENIQFIKAKELTAEQVARVLSRDCLNHLCEYLGIENFRLKEIPTAKILLRELWKFNDKMYDRLDLWNDDEIEEVE